MVNEVVRSFWTEKETVAKSKLLYASVCPMPTYITYSRPKDYVNVSVRFVCMCVLQYMYELVCMCIDKSVCVLGVG